MTTMKIAMKNDNEKHLIGNRAGKVAKAREPIENTEHKRNKNKKTQNRKRVIFFFSIGVFFGFWCWVLNI